MTDDNMIRGLFSREIDREIKEVIKVDDHQSILREIEEYVPTKHIADELIDVLNVFQETIQNPSEEINIWISGFFGSGKSSFAKVLGYLLSNPTIGEQSVAKRFFELNELPRARQLLETIHSQAPTESVLLDLNTTPNVLEEGEPIVLPIYRTLLAAFDYSRDLLLAELEFDLESKGTLDAFTAKFEEVFASSWLTQRDFITSKNAASRVLHELDSKTFPAADSWSNAAKPPSISAKWFASRAVELLRRRRKDKERLVLVVDEVGQYVSRSTDRMRHLQGLAEECQKTEGKLWLVATSQEKLTDVVDSLGGKEIELAKAQDRFPIRVDLLPSDIDEVTGKRVLDKTAKGAKRVRELLDADRHKLTASVTLESDRYSAFSDDDFVRLYPLVPYQLQILIDAVSARRAQGGAPMTMGGSNRTLIRHAQQLLSHPSVGLADEAIGALVTLDRSYVLLEDVIPGAWRYEVDQVAAKHGEDSLETRVMRAIALCTGVPGLLLNARNLAVVLHPSISADPIEPSVRTALDQLVAEDRVRESDDGFQLQSPDQKDWEKTRRNIDMKPGDAVRLRKRILKDALGSMTVSKGRTFKIELHAEREKVSDGDISIDVRDDQDIEGLRRFSRTDRRVYWAYQTANDTWDALTELHRSEEMLERYDNAGASDAQRVLLDEERKRRDRALKTAGQLVARDVTGGTTVFDGTTEDAPAGDLRVAADRLVTGLLPHIYPNLDVFAGSFKKAEILQVLQADSLDGLADTLGPDGLGLYRLVASGRELATDVGPIQQVIAYVEARKQYGEPPSGAQLERHFGEPPFGAPLEALQASIAGAVRAGLIEVVSQAARITSSTDRRLEQVFGNIPKFRAATFRPAEDTGPPPEVRAEVSEWLAGMTGEPHSLDLRELAAAGRMLFNPLRQPCTEARSTLAGAGLPVPDVLTMMEELLSRVMSVDDELVVLTLHERRTDLADGRRSIAELADLVQEHIGTLKKAKWAVGAAPALDRPEAEAWSTEVQELLDRARYAEDLARVRSLVTTIEEALATEEARLREHLVVTVEAAVERLRVQYPKVDDGVFAERTSGLVALCDVEGLPLLRANIDAVAGVERRIENGLIAPDPAQKVRIIRVGEIWSGPIASPEDLTLAIARIEERVLAELDGDTEVRLR